MKTKYVKPEIYVEEFLPKQRIAACDTSMGAIWKDVTFQCEEYNTSADQSCSTGSQHNTDLKNLKSAIETVHPNPFTTASACSSVCANLDTLETWIAEYLSSTNTWKKQKVQLPNGGEKVMVVTRNSHEHVVDIAGFNMYTDTFASF